MTEEQEARCIAAEEKLREILDEYAVTFVVEAGSGRFFMVCNEDLEDRPRLH